MKPRNEEEGPRATLEKIKLDLVAYKIFLHFKDHEEPLVLHFDTPSRRFYFALIALVVTEMKNLGKPGFIYIRKHEKTLRLLDHWLAGPHASETSARMRSQTPGRTSSPMMSTTSGGSSLPWIRFPCPWKISRSPLGISGTMRRGRGS
jgi:hypothetical protein